ncbi:hypothetical protein EV44_g3961 [Erysiphe necator]|uniref:Uncharacterized protein n=1 Tax=Uncinula necator TaxID=52586 RepID=A0A0B1PBF0_UNCNE|nr:hypothetical protein EV44_g3961 [Erysiphe necator]
MVTQNKEASLARAKSLLEERYYSSLIAFWSSQAPKQYKDLEIRITSRIPPELSLLPRWSLGKLLAARSGHGDFASYHRRFYHKNADHNCSCRLEKSPEHPFSCQLTRRLRGRLRGHLKHNMNNFKLLYQCTNPSMICRD